MLFRRVALRRHRNTTSAVCLDFPMAFPRSLRRPSLFRAKYKVSYYDLPSDWLGYSKPQNLSSVCQNANKGAEAKKAAHSGRRYFSSSAPSHSRLRRSLLRLRRFCLCARNPTIRPATQATIRRNLRIFRRKRTCY